jgi:hypothetical protein
MRMRDAVVTCVVCVMLAAHTFAGECEAPSKPFLERVKPAGGFSPYPGGLLHWWPRDCFPCGGAPDDYCRKCLPKVCWPPYPYYFGWGAPERPSCPCPKQPAACSPTP